MQDFTIQLRNFQDETIDEIERRTDEVRRELPNKNEDEVEDYVNSIFDTIEFLFTGKMTYLRKCCLDLRPTRPNRINYTSNDEYDGAEQKYKKGLENLVKWGKEVIVKISNKVQDLFYEILKILNKVGDYLRERITSSCQKIAIMSGKMFK